MAEPGNAQGQGALTQAMTKPGGDPLLATVLLGRYRIDKRLGEGGMGTVYLAEHMTIRKKVAVKVLAADMGKKPDVRARFLQEAQAASMVHQQNIVEITDYGDTPDGRAFFIMEFLDGEDLSNTVEREGGLPWLRVRPMLTQICEALQAAHDAGIIHRDMKPENCYRIKRGGSDDFIKVLDFGIAKVSSVEEEGGKGLTKTGMIFGTPEYMSPEQAQGQKVDHRVDIYAMGVIMFELLTGQTPFQGDTFMSILTKHLFEAPPAPLSVNPQADISPEIEAIMLKAMQKDPALRFGSMAEMSTAISAVGTGAAAVAVVQEQLSAAPSGGQMHFVGSSAPTMSDMPGATGYPVGGTYPPYEQAEESRSKAPLIALFSMLALAGIGTTAYLVMGGGATPTPTPAPPVAASGPVVAAPEPTPEPAPEHVKELAPETPKVMLTIETNDGAGNPVIARVVDAVDDGIYGRTNGVKGVSVEKSSEMHSFILRADGFEDLVMKFVPSQDKRFVKELKAKSDKPDTTRGGGSKPSKGKDKGVSAYDLPGVAPTPKTTPKKPEPKPEPKPELKPSPLPEPKPEPKPEPAFNPSKDATPKVPPKKKKGAKPGELVNPFDG